MSARHGCAALIVVAALGSGCIPVSSFRPNTPMAPGQSNEIGWGLSAGGVATSGPNVENKSASFDFWYVHQFSGWFDLGLRAFGGAVPRTPTSSDSVLVRNGLSIGSGHLVDAALGAGLSLRFNVMRRERFRLGIDVNGGFPWLQIGLPLAVKVQERVWIYSSPQVNYYGNLALAVPVGASVRITPGCAILVEMTVHLLGPQVALIDGGVGIAFRY